MDEKTALRIIDAFDAVRQGYFRADATEITYVDADTLKARYNEIKWGDISFGDAMRQAQAECIMRIVNGRAHRPG